MGEILDIYEFLRSFTKLYEALRSFTNYLVSIVTKFVVYIYTYIYLYNKSKYEAKGKKCTTILIIVDHTKRPTPDYRQSRQRYY